eukprot:TRINITY_DN23486_c0_g1_i7.p1 TRINITY_DN23486_c0_g1~~TRINITY_DN23486_c0_g1_i7.p1  ORF type:complete len:327 (+),score=48.95 TRINITY_DN23486_c0_g1_i7:110-1090(+)
MRFFGVVKALENLAIVRITIGPSDFSLSNYDWQIHLLMQDVFYMGIKVPLMQRVLRLRPDLKIMAAPWSPPLGKCIGNSNTPAAWSQYEDLDWYARELADFVRFTREECGIPIHYLSLQNEPLHVTSDYPSFHLWKEAAANLRRCLKRQLPDMAVVIYDHNPDKNGLDYVNHFLHDPTSLFAGDVFGWHLYEGELEKVPEATRDIGGMMTEITSTWFKSDGSLGDSYQGCYDWTKDQVCKAVRKKFSYYIYWNLFDEPTAKDGHPSGRTVLKQMRIRDDAWIGRPLIHVKEDLQQYRTTGKLYRLADNWAVNDVFADFRSGKVRCD